MKGNSEIKLFNGLLIILFLIFGSFLYYNDGISFGKYNHNTNDVNGKLNIYFLDVGQADSILINYDNEYALIDAGNNADGSLLVDYFKDLNINEFKYVFGTHAHEDHIGGMDDIINNFKINNFYMPDVVTTTKTFEDVLDSLDKNNVKFDTPSIGDTFTLGDTELIVLYIGNDSKNLNNSSIVLKLSYKDTSYLFMGDATSVVEKKLNKSKLHANVIKIGHHGSEYSSTETFIKSVNPQYAIISVGKNNSYNHPSSTIINRLKDNNIKIYRTDEDGTIVLNSNGININFNTISTNTNG